MTLRFYKTPTCSIMQKFLILLLLFSGASHSLWRSERVPPLFDACHKNNSEQALLLMEQGAELDEMVPNLACCSLGKYNDSVIFHYLLNHCSFDFQKQIIAKDIELKGKERLKKYLHKAIDLGIPYLVEYLINEQGADPHLAYCGNLPFVFNMNRRDGWNKDAREKIALLLKSKIYDLVSFYGIRLASNDLKPIPKPTQNGGDVLDAHMDEVDLYLSIMREYNNNRRLSKESINLLHEKLDEALLLFKPTIESGVNFHVAEPYWRALEQEVLDVKASELVNMAIVNIIGFKLSLLADLSRTSSKESSDEFLAGYHPRLKKPCLFYTDSPKVSFVLTTHALNDFHQFHIDQLLMIVPLISENSLFGLRTFLHAACQGASILAYSPAGSSEAHGGYIASFYSDSRWAADVPQTFWSKLDIETFPSSCLLLDHDCQHLEIYAPIINETKSINLYRDLYIEVSKNFFDNQDNLLDFALLFLLFHEKGLKINKNARHLPISFNSQSKEETIRIYGCETELEYALVGTFPSFDFVIPFLRKDYENSYEAEFQQSKKDRAIFEFKDIALLLLSCGAKLEFDFDQPWNSGPEIARVLLEHVRTSSIGKILQEHSASIDRSRF